MEHEHDPGECQAQGGGLRVSAAAHQHHRRPDRPPGCAGNVHCNMFSQAILARSPASPTLHKLIQPLSCAGSSWRGVTIPEKYGSSHVYMPSCWTMCRECTRVCRYPGELCRAGLWWWRCQTSGCAPARARKRNGRKTWPHREPKLPSRCHTCSLTAMQMVALLELWYRRQHWSLPLSCSFSRCKRALSKQCMQAELAARDLMRLSRPGSKGATGTSAPPEGSGFAWSFLSHLSAMVLNRLQMTISNVHICFQVTFSLCDPPRVSGEPALLKRTLCYAHLQCHTSFWPVPF